MSHSIQPSNIARRAKERASGGRAAAEAVLPMDHKLGMQVPKGGSMCANWEYLADATHCGNDGFIKWNGEAKLPNAADEYCCDLYGPKSKVQRANGGKVHVGPIRTKHPGRTDTVPMKVADGSYVLPSETISHLGQNNSEAGLRVADSLFGANGSFTNDAAPRARGGKTESGKPIDCITAGGEYVIGPEKVKAIGRGDIDLGHKILDKFVLNQRKAHIHALSSLDPPARD